MPPPAVPALSLWLPQAMEGLQSSLPLTLRLSITALFCVCISVWTRYVVSRRQVGLPRFLAALPVVLGNCLIPLIFSAEAEVCSRTGMTFCFVWLCNAKVETPFLTLQLLPLADTRCCLYCWLLLTVALVLSWRPNQCGDALCSSALSRTGCTNGLTAVCCCMQVLGFAVGRGPLCMQLPALQFGVVLVAPVTPRLGAPWLQSAPPCPFMPESCCGTHMRGCKSPGTGWW